MAAAMGMLPPCIFPRAFFRLTAKRLATFPEPRRATKEVSSWSPSGRPVREWKRTGVFLMPEAIERMANSGFRSKRRAVSA